MKDASILCAVFLISGAMIVMKKSSVQQLLSLRRPSKLWARLVGLSGLLWVVLAVFVHDDLGILDGSSEGAGALRVLRYYVGGVAVGPFIALSTKHKEGV